MDARCSALTRETRPPLTAVIADIYDDEREMYATALTVSGVRVRVIGETDAAKVAAMIEADRPDVVIARIRPEFFGIDLTRELRARAATAAVTVVLITTYADPAIHQQARETGANTVLTLPVSPPDLIRAVHQHVNRWTPAKENVSVRPRATASTRP